MDDFYRQLEIIEATPLNGTLAIITRVEGSAYRKEGASMVILEDGTTVGVLSGGCLEADLIARVENGLPSIEPYVGHAFTYDLSAEDDLSWGKGAGCNGVVHVVLEPLTPSLRRALLRLKSCLDRGLSTVGTICVDSSGQVIGHTFLADDGTTFGSGRPDPLADVFTFRYEPRSRLVIFGAGPDVKPLTELAARSGFTVALADGQAARCNKDCFPHVRDFYVGKPEDLLETIAISELDALVIMTHDFQVDKILLKGLQKKRCMYLGILGPRQRTTRLLDGAPIPDDVHSPVGLAIGAEGPEEIAVSIMADIIKTKHEANKSSHLS